MKPVNIFYFIFIIFTFAACGISEKQSNEIYSSSPPYLIKVDNSLAQPFSSNEIFKTKRIIKLEKKEGLFIGRVDKVKIDDHHIYVLDRNLSKKLFVFDYDGRYMFHISFSDSIPTNQELTDFDILEDGSLYILDGTSAEIFVYSPLGKFDKKIKLDGYYHSIVLGKETFVLVKNERANNFEDSTKFYNLKFFNYSGDLVSAHHPFNIPIGVQRRVYSAEPPITRSENDAIYNSFPGDTLYKANMNDGSISPYYIVNFSENMVTRKMLSDGLDLAAGMAAGQNKYSFGPFCFMDQPQFLSFIFVNNSESNFFFHDKITNGILLTNLIYDNDNQQEALVFPEEAFGNYLIGVVDETRIQQNRLDQYRGTQIREICRNVIDNGDVYCILYELK